MVSLHSPDVLKLTPLERIGPKGYLQYVFPFELPEGYIPEEIVHTLKAGYYAASTEFAPLAYEAVPDTEANQVGVWKLQPIDDSELEAITLKELRTAGRFPYTFTELKEKSFPVSAFEMDTIMRRHVWPGPDEPNFISGGLILGWSILHMVGDGTTLFVWAQTWVEECRRAQNLDISSPIELPRAIYGDRELVIKSSGRNAGRLQDHNEYTLLPFTPQWPPPKMVLKHHRGQVFYFSPEALKELKEAQFPLDALEGNSVSIFNIVIDGRRRTNPPVHPQTLGCFLEYVALSLPIRDMLSSLRLSGIAIPVREAVLRANKEWTDDITTLIDKHVEDVDRLVATAFLDTSWVDFALYDLDRGLALGNKIQAVRSPSCGVINGLQVIFPVLPNGGLEVLVTVEENCLSRLLHEPLWNRFATVM
ncbi:hypothetical protein BX600DRAFT_484186 [Xylariales sp. PMI_506]|nr:hypothetical protein BX600DRAFT_484186 [Xylariales sp. PMI_506]